MRREVFQGRVCLGGVLRDGRDNSGTGVAVKDLVVDVEDALGLADGRRDLVGWLRVLYQHVVGAPVVWLETPLALCAATCLLVEPAGKNLLVRAVDVLVFHRAAQVRAHVESFAAADVLSRVCIVLDRAVAAGLDLQEVALRKLGVDEGLLGEVRAHRVAKHGRRVGAEAVDHLVADLVGVAHQLRAVFPKATESATSARALV